MPGVHSTQGGSVGVPVSCRLLRRLAWGRSRSSPQLPPAALQGRIEPPSVSGRRWACDGGCRAPRPAARPMAWQGGVRAPLLLSPTAARLHSTPVRSPSFSLCIEGWGFAGLALLLALAHSTRLGKGPRLGDSQGAGPSTSQVGLQAPALLRGRLHEYSLDAPSVALQSLGATQSRFSGVFSLILAFSRHFSVCSQMFCDRWRDGHLSFYNSLDLD